MPMIKIKMELLILLNIMNSSKISSKEWEENAIILLILQCNEKYKGRIQEGIHKKNEWICLFIKDLCINIYIDAFRKIVI